MGLFNWLFRKLCQRVFKQVDRDANGKIDKLEVEIAVLYLYNVINKRLPGWQDPPNSEDIQAALNIYDKDGNGVLDVDEFTEFSRGLLKSGPDVFFARVGKSAMVNTAFLPTAAFVVQRGARGLGLGGIPDMPMHFLAPILGTLFNAVRALIPST